MSKEELEKLIANAAWRAQQWDKTGVDPGYMGDEMDPLTAVFGLVMFILFIYAVIKEYF